MNLEDHLGDIIRKARMMSNVSTTAAANAAGIPESELGALEDSGNAIQEMNFEKLGHLLGLNPQKLEKIALGWTPVAKNVGLWKGFEHFTTTEGMAVNNYLLWDATTHEAALFDTGWDATPAFEAIKEHKLDLKHLFITHTHEDHVAAMGTVRSKYPAVQLHSSSARAPQSQRNRADVAVQLGSLHVSNRSTPGHAEDGVTYVVTHWPDNAPPVAIVGDAIFAGSMGRGNQSWDIAKQAVREQILTLPEGTLICPGHGPLTTVGEEKTFNPFF